MTVRRLQRPSGTARQIHICGVTPDKLVSVWRRSGLGVMDSGCKTAKPERFPSLQAIEVV